MIICYVQVSVMIMWYLFHLLQAGVDWLVRWWRWKWLNAVKRGWKHSYSVWVPIFYYCTSSESNKSALKCDLNSIYPWIVCKACTLFPANTGSLVREHVRVVCVGVVASDCASVGVGVCLWPNASYSAYCVWVWIRVCNGKQMWDTDMEDLAVYWQDDCVSAFPVCQ